MPVKFAPHQLAFWRELLAPFPDHQLSTTKRGGKDLTYIDKRALTNRLDSVVGPHGWYPEYEATARGYKCRLYILVPMFTEGTEVFMHKEDGAGFEEMGAYKKAWNPDTKKMENTEEFETDTDNDEKSGYTNAFRRAAQDAWGIGRYLYQKGIPDFLDPNASSPNAPSSQGPSTSGLGQPQQPSQPAPPAASQRPSPSPTSNGSTGNSGTPSQQGGGGYDNFKIPKPGKSVFAWVKEMEKTFETPLVDGMGADGEEQGWGRQFNNWTEAQVNTICLKVIGYIRGLPTYKNQFEHLFPGGVPDAKIPQTKGSGPNTPAPAPGINVADLRKKLMASMQALITKQTGSAPDNVALKFAFNVIAAEATNAQGHAGLIPESLSSLTDAVWINNMLAIVDREIAATAVPAEAGDPSIPF